ncbi:MAG: glutamate formimidoyltransferase [Candidatus Eremiobacteraeota bacterium]|nr:glutamate formimidoyltransferase [Candidatus Eremiobacteraeota bacterium]
MKLFESVPNISEGRNLETIDACVRAAEQCGALVLHRTSDPVHNRSVLTLAGSREALSDAGVAMAGAAMERIDLRTHRGVHPRIGALDVLPFVPLREATLDEAVALARETAGRIWDAHRIPSFLYGAAASTPLRRNLASIRAGQFEGLDARFSRPQWRPDFGDPRAHATAGAIAVGARDILVAFNIELKTGELAIATRIAREIRERDGGFRTLKALGLRLRDDLVQVSLNVTDFRATPLYQIVEVVRRLAERDGVGVHRCELIGCLPLEAVQTSADYYLQL